MYQCCVLFDLRHKMGYNKFTFEAEMDESVVKA